MGNSYPYNGADKQVCQLIIIRVFKTKLGALIYQISKNTNYIGVFGDRKSKTRGCLADKD